MHSLKCCSLQGERQGGEDRRAAHTCKAPSHTSSRSFAPPPIPHWDFPPPWGYWHGVGAEIFPLPNQGRGADLHLPGRK